MAKQTKPAATLQPIESTMKDVFGDHPTNVIAHIQYGAEALDWMESIFHGIEKQHDNEGSGSHIKKLAGLGKYVAFDISNTLGCQYEEYSEKLEAAISESEAAK